MRCVLACLTLSSALLLAATAQPALIPTQTKRQAEINVLRALPHLWKVRRLHGLVNPRTHLLADGTEAICHARSKRHAGERYRLFRCVVRPHVHTRLQGLHVRYRALPHGRFTIRWVSYHRR